MSLIKVLFFSHSMEGGGAERVVVRLVSQLDRNRFSPVLVLMEEKGPFLAEIPPDVPIYSLNVKETNALLFPKLLFRLRKVLKEVKPDLVFSILWYANISAVIAAKGLPVKIIISERIWTPFEINARTKGKLLRLVKRLLLRWLYPHADHVVVVSEAIAEELVQNFGMHRQKVSIIPNPALSKDILSQIEKQADPWQPRKGFRIVSMGRLEPQKGHDILIRAIAGLPKDLELQVKILGEGPERQKLTGLISNLGVREIVHLEGFQNNPYPYLKYADLFVLPSRAEGFPNALLEAMSFGLPVIAADCPTGPREILQDGVVAPLFGVGDVESLIKWLAEIIQDPTPRDLYSNNVKMRIEDFDIEKIRGCYEELFLSSLSPL